MPVCIPPFAETFGIHPDSPCTSRKLNYFQVPLFSHNIRQNIVSSNFCPPGCRRPACAEDYLLQYQQYLSMFRPF